MGDKTNGNLEAIMGLPMEEPHAADRTDRPFVATPRRW
jgi:hypothetical protein